jgi:hypothetical protein
MERTIRYCRGCGASTDHWREGFARRLSWRWVLLELALAPCSASSAPGGCELCEAREADKVEDEDVDD